jgi:hypothetical protein
MEENASENIPAPPDKKKDDRPDRAPGLLNKYKKAIDALSDY